MPENAPLENVIHQIVVSIDGISLSTSWFGRDGSRGMPVWIANWLDDLIHQAIYEANPGTRIEVRRQ